MKRPAVVVCLMLLVTVVLLTLLVTPLKGLTTEQVRDNRQIASVGTAMITGIVVTADREGRPLRRARVSLTAAELDVGRIAISADDGTFSFDRLPPGRYSISASKDGYVTMSAGAERPGKPGPAIELRAGQAAQATVRLPPGAVITGTVRFPGGEPAANVSVAPLMERYVPAAGERRLGAPLNTTVMTDDRGVYRIFGLAAGTYIVGATPRVFFGGPMVDFPVLSDAEIRRALAEVRQSATSPRPGMPSPPAPPSRGVEPPRTNVAFAPIYYPGTALERQAAAITLAAGEVRVGIDIDLDYVRTAIVEGFVTMPADARVQLTLANADSGSANPSVRTASPMADGRFQFRSVPPGHYAITARAVLTTTQPGGGPIAVAAWGRTEIMVAGDDLSGITIPLRAPVTISGRVAFKGATPPPPLPTLKVPIPSTSVILGSTSTLVLPNVTLDSHRFTIPGAIPGVYRLRTQPPGIRTPIGVWWLESVIANGVDLLDSEFELREDIQDAVITFTDRASELSGAVRYASGAAFREGVVVVFSADRRTWFLNSRRVAALQPSPDGRYAIRNLPPGDYFVTVAVGLERNEWFDPEVLASLAQSAQRISIAALELKTHDLTLR